MPAFINGVFLPTPDTSDDEEQILQLRPSAKSYEQALFNGYFSWTMFKICLQRYLQLGSERSSYKITLQTPFSLVYLALKAWFNSIYWDEAYFMNIREGTPFDSFFYKLSPMCSEGVLTQSVTAVNVSMASQMRRFLEKLQEQLQEEVQRLPAEYKNKFVSGVLEKKDLLLKNNASMTVEVCSAIDLLFPEEYEPQGYYSYLRLSDFDRVLDYNFKQHRFILEK